MKNHTKIFFFTTLDMWYVGSLNYARIINVNHFDLIIDKLSGYYEESNGNTFRRLF